jgi:DNA-binding NarL/FixJ family response regulator
VVDDYSPARVKISRSVESLKNYCLLGMAKDGHELIKFCYNQKELPDIVLLDVHMEKMDGVTVMEFMGTYFPDIKVIAVSAYETELVIIDMFSAGAWGYVFKDKELSMLSDALLSVESNMPYADPRLLFDITRRDILIEKRKAEKELLTKKYALTPREKEILGLIVSNMAYPEISQILNIAPKTIENTINTLNNKLGIENGWAGLLLHSLRIGLTKVVSLRVETALNIQ